MFLLPSAAPAPRAARLLASFVLLYGLAACGGPDAPPVAPPTPLLQPADLTVTEGQRAEFTAAFGTTADVRLQWRRNGQAIAGATAPSYAIAATTRADDGASFDVVATNAAGSTTSRAARLAVNPLVPPPAITTSPASATVALGAPASFGVVATGSGLSYQWQRGTTNIAGATAATYTLPAASPADDGATFRVVVTNLAGSATSAAATLTVVSQPTIATQPADAGVTVGTPATFSVVASGTGLSYRWQRGTADIPGATGASYTTPATVLGDDGATFRVIVANAAGSTTSRAATLTVTDPTPPATFRTTPTVVGTDGSGLALKADGTVWAWGANRNGELGQGGTSPSPSPVQVRTVTGTLQRIVELGAGPTHVLALDADGNVWAWGTTAALGIDAPNGGTASASAARVVTAAGGAPLANVVDVAAGDGISLAALADGTVVAWGVNTRGQTGTLGPNVYFPATVPGVAGIVEVAAGAERSHARSADGRVYSWGDNATGALGNGTTTSTGSPVTVSGIGSAVRIEAGRTSAQAILADGTARIWGGTAFAAGATPALGTGNCTNNTATSPVVVALPAGTASSFATATAIAGGEAYAYGGRLYESGDIASDATAGTCTRGLLEFAGLANVVGVARTWGAFTHAWTGDGRVYGLGLNDAGQLGIGDTAAAAGARELAGFNLLGDLSAGTSVFYADFESPLPAEIAAGTATRVGAQGYAGLGSAGNAFAGNLLRSATGNVVTVTLTNLPAHSSLSLQFLYAAIDSLDGAGTFPAGDYFRITMDGRTIFREAFSNALPTQVQTYLPPPGVELARRVDLGFSGPGSFFTDSAYDLGRDPQFIRIPHTASTVTFTFEIEGAGIQSLDDESWGIDNLRISVSP